jgi:hypothetical protein
MKRRMPVVSESAARSAAAAQNFISHLESCKIKKDNSVCKKQMAKRLENALVCSGLNP